MKGPGLVPQFLHFCSSEADENEFLCGLGVRKSGIYIRKECGPHLDNFLRPF